MKRLTALLIVLDIVSYSAAPASAELLKNFHLGGQIDVQATNATNIKDFATGPNANTLYPLAGGGTCGAGGCSNNDRINDVQTRVMVNMDWDLLDDVHAKVGIVKNDRAWGTKGGNAFNDGQSEALIGTAAGSTPGVANNIFVNQASFKVDKVAGQFDLTMGRQNYGDPNDIVIYFGPSEKASYDLPYNAVDAARVDWSGSESFAVTALAGALKNAGVGTAPQADSNLFGIDFTGKSGDAAKGSLYLWNKVTHNTGASGAPPTDNPATAGGENDDLYVVGFKGKVAGGGFWLKGEFDQDFGDNRVAGNTSGNFAGDSRYMGFATMGDAGYKAEDDNIGMISFWAQSAMGSGRSSTRESHNDGWVPINTDYRPGSIYGRFAFSGLLGSGVPLVGNNANTALGGGLSNRVIWGGGIKMSPAAANKFQLALSYWDFRLHRFADLPYATPAYDGNSHIGSEFDVDMTWTHSENVSFGAGWATFQPGGAIYNAVNDANRVAATTNAPGPNTFGQGVNPANLTYFDVRVKF
jgi:hypothetical protein